MLYLRRFKIRNQVDCFVGVQKVMMIESEEISTVVGPPVLTFTARNEGRLLVGGRSSNLLVAIIHAWRICKQN